MKKPDRFARAVQKLFNPTLNPIRPLVRLDDVALVLRAEHRAVVRLVKRHKFSKHNNAYEAAWDRPLDMILVALSRRAK